MTKVCALPPVVVGEVFFGFSPVRGEVISVMRMPQDLMTASGKQAIIEGVQLAVRRGAHVISLGALTAPATGGGQRLLRVLPPGVTLTNGNAYTAAVVAQNVDEASAALGIGKQARVAVVGCTGSVGTAVSSLLAEAGYDLILVGRTAERVQHQFTHLKGRAVMTSALTALREAHIIVLLTNDPSARLTPDDAQRGAFIIDCAQPPNIPASAYGEFQDKEMVVVEGALVCIPGYRCTYNFGLPNGSDTFACLTEAYLFAREGLREHSVGKPSVEQVRLLERVATRYGVGAKSLDFDRHRHHMPAAHPVTEVFESTYRQF